MELLWKKGPPVFSHMDTHYLIMTTSGEVAIAFGYIQSKQLVWMTTASNTRSYLQSLCPHEITFHCFLYDKDPMGMIPDKEKEMNETFKDVLKNLACALDTKGTTDPLVHFKGGYAFVYTDYYAETEVPEECQGTLTLSSLKKAGDFPLKQTAWAGEVVHMARGRTKMAIAKEGVGLKKIQRKPLPLEGGIVPVGKLLEGMDFCRKTLLQHDSFSSLSCFFFRKDGAYTTNGESFSFFPCEFSNNFCLPHDAYSKIKGFQAEECTLSGSESLTFTKKGSSFFCPTFQTDTIPPFKRILSQQFSALFRGDSSAWDINPKEITTLVKNATDVLLTGKGKDIFLQINGAGSVYKQPLFPSPEQKTVYISKETLSAILSAEEIGLNDKCIKVSLPGWKDTHLQFTVGEEPCYLT